MGKVQQKQAKREKKGTTGTLTGLFGWVVEAGLEQLQRQLEEERAAACGPRSKKNPDRQARRMGHAPGELVLAGRKVRVSLPRARTMGGEEVRLPSWEEFSVEDPLTAQVVRQLLLGVSTRGTARGWSR